MKHPDAVLRFMSPTAASRLCRDYDTPHGQFIRELFEFVWGTPNINAGVVLASAKKPACITLRYVEERPDSCLGRIALFKHCTQDTELVRQLHFTHSGQDVRVFRWLRYMRPVLQYRATTGWLRSEFQFFSLSEAVVDTIWDYRCLLAAASPGESMWSPPPVTN